MGNKSGIELDFPMRLTLTQDKPHGKLDIESSSGMAQTLALYIDGLGNLMRIAEVNDDFEFTDEQMERLFGMVKDKVKELRNDLNQERVSITPNK